MNQSLHELPSTERPREKLVSSGAPALTNAELIAIFLRTGIPGKNAIVLADELIRSHGTLTALSQSTAALIAKHHGIGPAKACQIAAAFELGARVAREQVTSTPLTTPQEIVAFLAPQMRQLRQESLRVISLNSRLKFIAMDEISRGTVNQTLSHPRDILHAAISRQAYGFVIAHNHPSGDSSPSKHDMQFTKRMAEAADLLQIQFVDHVIIGHFTDGKVDYHSFREDGTIL